MDLRVSKPPEIGKNMFVASEIYLLNSSRETSKPAKIPGEFPIFSKIPDIVPKIVKLDEKIIKFEQMIGKLKNPRNFNVIP